MGATALVIVLWNSDIRVDRLPVQMSARSPDLQAGFALGTLTTDVLADRAAKGKRSGRPGLFCCLQAKKGTLLEPSRLSRNDMEVSGMKGIILWLMGVPLIVIVLLYMFVF
ncbi:hypothetical protein [Sinorhizobium terangae]|uniref:Uncharacterized protein n=1 Tax=Sinorhizobium terangae TaxID=110322 RepID=A0A6N7LBJ4_SINTE|nr:hypothetical protein [Sinorhizobium terangae]MQX14124.1 hypothetical protein [Sinorhizobium terangae]WFU51467.1 hypothetical protein QA637_23170 [Sinorhizobium terangae]